MKRQSGVLLPVFSLPGDYGCGSFGEGARAFIDKLADGGFSVWQVLPFCLPDECHSPYKSYGAFSGNPLFLDLPTLCEKGLITRAELDAARQKTPYLCEWERLDAERMPLFGKAAARFSDHRAMDAFFGDHPEILSFCRFMAIKENNGGAPFTEWTTEEPDENALALWKFLQYEFFTEWQTVRDYAHERGISIIGDLPIYVAEDSADVWAHPDLFLLDERKKPTRVAGVPPDYFAKDGQLWGNPLYDWKAMKRDGYAWWQTRIRESLALFDGVRIDHFRAFDAYFSIPKDAKTAKAGKWVKGPGLPFVKTLRRAAESGLLIAEDLGVITDSVRKLVSDSGCPGMRVLQFALDGNPDSPHLPHNYVNNCVAYTGTHDNNTLLGFLFEADEGTRRRLLSYCGFAGEDWNTPAAYRAVERALFASAAGLVILPAEDLLLWGADTRINTPGKPDGNWQWRLTESALASIDTSLFSEWNDLYARR